MEGFIVFIFIIVLIVVIGVAYYSEQKKREKELADARQAYLDSLDRLKSAPTNADLRQTTLSLGRTYSDMTRKRQGVTIYDEMALMNDIGAACAGATAHLGSVGGVSQQSIEDRLAKLASLRDRGLIDEQEYALKREKILDEI